MFSWEEINLKKDIKLTLRNTFKSIKKKSNPLPLGNLQRLLSGESKVCRWWSHTRAGFSIRIEVGGRIVEVGGEEVTRAAGATF